MGPFFWDQDDLYVQLANLITSCNPGFLPTREANEHADRLPSHACGALGETDVSRLST